MKTITEFAGPTLKNAAKTQAELTAAGKTAEELPQALGEALKLEGDKLGLLLSALEIVGTRLDDLKRVVVLSVTEGEKAPSGAKQKGEHAFLTEYFPPIRKPGAHPAGGPQGKGDRGRGGKRDGKRGKGRGRRDERGGRGERGGQGGDAAHAGGKPGDGKRDGRPPRPARGPKPNSTPST